MTDEPVRLRALQNEDLPRLFKELAREETQARIITPFGQFDVVYVPYEPPEAA